MLLCRRFPRMLFLTAVVLWISGIATARADMITTTFGVAADVYVHQNGTRSTNTTLVAGNPAVGTNDHRAFLRFDLSGLSAEPIVDATLRLYLQSTQQYGGAGLREVTTAWTPTTVLYNQPVSAQLAWFAPAPWPAIGWYEISVTDTVQAWQADPAQNFGFSIRGAEGFTLTGRAFTSSSGTEANRPQLVVSQIPEPSAGLLLLFGVAGLVARRPRRGSRAM